MKHIEELDYDPTCERLDTAIKAIWLLFRRAKWGFLAQVGMPRSQVETDLVRFDLEQVAAEHGRIRSEAQCWMLIRYCPLVLTAAMQMLSRYQQNYARSRHRYYEELGKIRELLIQTGGGFDEQDNRVPGIPA